jgi:hypothetical protein
VLVFTRHTSRLRHTRKIDELWLFYCKRFSLLPVGRADQLLTPDDRRPLADVVQTPTWKWVVEVYKTRGFSVDVIDEHLNVLAPLSRGGTHPPVDSITLDAVRYLAPAIGAGHAETASVRGHHFCTMPFVASGAVAGAALVGGDAEQAREDEVQRAAALLSRVLEDDLSTTESERPTSRRLAALHDLLDEARGASERHVFQVFAEIMNVWDDAEIIGYRGDLDGRYMFAAALPGSDRSKLPDVIDADIIPQEALVTLTPGLQRQLGFAEARYPVLVRLSTLGGPWLMAATHRPGSQQLPEWFDFYLAALVASLNASLEHELSRVTGTITQHLVDHESPRQAASHAVRSVAAALSAEGSFTMWEPDGSLAFGVGEPLVETSAEIRGADLLRVRINAPAGRHARLEMRAIAPHQFTQRDVRLFDGATWTLSRWFSTMAEQLAAPREQLAPAQSFDEVVERCVRAGRRSGSAALILIMPGHADASSDLAFDWIRRLRSRLRPTDLAGRLATGEVAVVAIETTPPGALVVARRIAHGLNESVDGAQKRVRVGLAAGVGATTSAHSLIAEARQHLVDA